MPHPAASRQPATVPQGTPLIRVEHLTRTIATRAQRTVILDDVTFTIPAQSLFAINGSSGSGKSTLLNMLTGIDRPSSGRVVFAGQELRAQGENALALWRGRHVGIIFQFFQLVPTLTARENVLLALEAAGLPPHFDEGFARQIFGRCRVVDDAQQKPKDAGAVPHKQSPHRVLIAGRDQCDQGLVRDGLWRGPAGPLGNRHRMVVSHGSPPP